MQTLCVFREIKSNDFIWINTFGASEDLGNLFGNAYGM